MLGEDCYLLWDRGLHVGGRLQSEARGLMEGKETTLVVRTLLDPALHSLDPALHSLL